MNKKELKEDVREIINMAGEDGVTLANLVRRLREKGHDPDLKDVQGELKRWRKELRVLEHGRLAFSFCDIGKLFVTREKSVKSVKKTERTEGQLLNGDKLLGTFETEASAYAAASTDWFGEGEVRAVWEDLDLIGSHKYTLRYFILGQAEMKQPTMPPYEKPVVTELPEKEYIAAELDAVRKALEDSLSEATYRRLRSNSGAVVKLTFSVNVDRTEKCVDAKMSGSTKMESRGSSRIKDPAQMELNL